MSVPYIFWCQVDIGTLLCNLNPSFGVIARISTESKQALSFVLGKDFSEFG